MTRPWLALGIAALLAACSRGVERPNVLLITLDTTRADALSCYGAPAGRTPHLDALATRGVRFERALSASALTPSSHATILTGRWPFAHGVRVMVADGGYALGEGTPTLAEVLGARGYRTAAVQSAFPVSAHFGLDRGFDHVDGLDADLARTPSGDGITWDVRRGQRRSDETTERARAFLRGADDPFFLWVHYWDPHDPSLLPPAGFLERQGVTSPGKNPETYAAEVAYMDAQIGALLRELERQGLEGSTLVCVIADHGEGLDDGVARHGWYGHRIAYEEQLHVPLLLAGPGVPRGRVVGGLARSVDVLPTLLDYADVPAPGRVDGASLRSSVEGGAPPERVAYAEAVNLFDLNAHVLVSRRPRSRLVHVAADERWKLLYRPVAPEESELFDTRDDPGETRDRYATEPEVVERLLGELAASRPWVLEPFAHTDGEVSAAALEILEALGYTGGADAEAALEGWEWLCPATGERFDSGPECASCPTPLVPVARRP